MRLRNCQTMREITGEVQKMFDTAVMLFECSWRIGNIAQNVHHIFEYPENYSDIPCNNKIAKIYETISTGLEDTARSVREDGIIIQKLVLEHEEKKP